VLTCWQRHDAYNKRDSGGRIYDDGDRCELLMSAALQVVDRDPQQAMAFAQMSVALGVSSNLSRLLTIMRGLDTERADLLFSNAMARLERSSQVDLAEVHTLGSYVVSVVNSGSKQPLSRPLVLRFLNFAFDQFADREQAIARTSKREDSPALYFVGVSLQTFLRAICPIDSIRYSDTLETRAIQDLTKME
jgi:hypothetical protein